MEYIIIIGLIVIFLLLAVVVYNSLIKARNRKDEAWSDIEVQLKRRYDLIPNLIKTVQGYAKHEKSVFEKVTKARTDALNAQSMEEHKVSENMLTDALKSVFAVAENYPDLKANENFLELQRELSDTENKIQAARRFFNSTVQDFNTKQQIFPQNMIASMFRFTPSEFFDIDEDERESVEKPVDVSF